jgi:hypothetical protein
VPFQSGNKPILAAWCESLGVQMLIDLAEGKGHGFREHKGRFIEIGPNRQLQFEALKLALSYGIGKPTEMVEITRAATDPAESKMRADEVWALIKELEDSANTGTNGTRGAAVVGDRSPAL